MADSRPRRSSPLRDMARRMGADAGVTDRVLDDDVPPTPLPVVAKRTFHADEALYTEIKVRAVRDRVDIADVLNGMMAHLAADDELYRSIVERARATAILRAEWKEFRRRNR